MSDAFTTIIISFRTFTHVFSSLVVELTKQINKISFRENIHNDDDCLCNPDRGLWG